MVSATQTTPRKHRLISVDSHANFTKEQVFSHCTKAVQAHWEDAMARHEAYVAKELRQGLPPLSLADFVDLDAYKDPGWSEPNARLKAMDRDGVEAEVLFPDFGPVAPVIAPNWLGADWKAAAGAYNDTMMDWARVNPTRLVSAYQIPLFDIEFACREVNRVAKEGARAVQLPSFPSDLGLPDVQDPRYDKLWSLLQETGIAVLNHLNPRDQMWPLFRRDPTPQKGIFNTQASQDLSEAMAFWILTGTLERFPTLKVILVEPGLGWIPWYLDILDDRFKYHYTFPGMKMKPSDYFKRQMGATFMYEPRWVELFYKEFGAQCLMWSSDFPHPATSWPDSQAKVEDQFNFAGITDADRDRITWGNAAKMFNL